MTEEAEAILLRCAGLQKEPGEVYPLIYYYLAYCAVQKGETERAIERIKAGEKAKSDCCFPHRLEDIRVLDQVQTLYEKTPMAAYYLGNLWYDKKQYEDAVKCWEKTAVQKPEFPTAHRNLALAYYNKRKNPEEAQRELEFAYRLDEEDSRVLLELDQLYKKTGKTPKERLEFLETHRETVLDRDDLTVEYTTLLNLTGQYEKALELIAGRNFHPWEGGEGKIPKQYLTALIQLAKEELKKGEYQEAEKFLLQAAGPYPWNLGEGKLQGAQENHIYYYLGLTYERMGEKERAEQCYEKASAGISEPVGAMYYNDQPPEMIYYQGASLAKLGRDQEARSRFHKLEEYGEKHIFDKPVIDYFAVSLPDLLIFEEDLELKNKIHCLFMLGLGRKEEAEKYFSQVLEMDRSHQGAMNIPEEV